MEPHNYDARFLNPLRNEEVMSQELADEAVVAVKPVADENMATYLRIKLSERDRKLKAKGGTRT